MTGFTAAFLHACSLDVEVRKPGNVSVASPGHGMDAPMFVAAAAAAAPALFEPGAPVGARIEGAVRASVAAAGCNTNLGIVLLVAPFALTLEAPGAAASATALRGALGRVLDALDRADAAAAYRGIALANPGGLGRLHEHDVRVPEPDLSLLDAMRLAAGRDRIARQYADGFAELFAIGLPVWQRGLGDAGSEPQAMLTTFIEWLASAPDSHIARKHGHEVAQQVRAEADVWRDRLATAGTAAPALVEQWDDSLKRRGLNPGTSADLSVATAFVAGCLLPPEQGAQAGKVLA